jgi:hypothetical protein
MHQSSARDVIMSFTEVNDPAPRAPGVYKEVNGCRIAFVHIMTPQGILSYELVAAG